MKLSAVFCSVAVLAHGAFALPGVGSCVTVTSSVVVPTTTYTHLSTYVTTVQATTPHVGTYTDLVVIPKTKTLRTLTTTVTDCTAYATITGSPTSIVYAAAAVAVRDVFGGRLGQRQAVDCTETVIVSTTSGATQLWIPTNETSTYTQYTAWSLETVSATTSKGTTYVIATATTTTCKVCGPTETALGSATSTITYDAKCATPTSANTPSRPTDGSFGLSWLNDSPIGGAVFTINATDHTTCCQQCVEQQGCAASAWDVRSNACHLEFPVAFDSGELNCGLGVQAYYNYGPRHPMAPGTGWHLAQVCGSVAIVAAKPDDGT